MTTPTMRMPTLRRVARAAGELAVADYPGTEPAIVAMHGFPDCRSINESLAQQLEGRRAVLFDFLGYGGSDKAAGHAYDAASFEDDLDAVVSELADGPVVIVAHDASGPTVINWRGATPSVPSVSCSSTATTTKHRRCASQRSSPCSPIRRLVH